MNFQPVKQQSPVQNHAIHPVSCKDFQKSYVRLRKNAQHAIFCCANFNYRQLCNGGTESINVNARSVDNSACLAKLFARQFRSKKIAGQSNVSYVSVLASSTFSICGRLIGNFSLPENGILKFSEDHLDQKAPFDNK